MHIALIVDEERLARERTTLHRLSLALIDQGAQLTRVIPSALPAALREDDQRRLPPAARLTAPMIVLPWMRRSRAAALAEAMERSEPDVIYAVGRRAWQVGLGLARLTDRQAALDVSSAEQVRQVPRERTPRAIGAYIAPTARLAEALKTRVEPDLVSLVPPGVAVPSVPHRILGAPHSAIALAIVGAGRDLSAYRALLNGLARIMRALPQVHAFLELREPHDPGIWRCIRELDLMSRISSIADAAQHRALLTRCDVLLVPEAMGEVSSVTYEAMAAGMPVIAVEDPIADWQVGDQAAVVLGSSDAGQWESQLQRLLTHPDRARAIGLAGRERVAGHHRSSDQAAKLLATFGRMIRGGNLPFAPAST
jgi:hypothetical protein